MYNNYIKIDFMLFLLSDGLIEYQGLRQWLMIIGK